CGPGESAGGFRGNWALHAIRHLPKMGRGAKFLRRGSHARRRILAGIPSNPIDGRKPSFALSAFWKESDGLKASNGLAADIWILVLRGLFQQLERLRIMILLDSGVEGVDKP